MIKYIFGIALSLFSFASIAQSSQLSDGGGVLMLIDLDDDKSTMKFERGSYNGKTHELGDSITSLLDKVEYSYVFFRETEGAYSTKEKNIEKPVIYTSLNKVMRYYDKLLRKDKIEDGKAREDLFEILNNGILLKNYNTEVFEMKLKSTRNKAELARLFQMVQFK
jgi:hypothetical protein